MEKYFPPGQWNSNCRPEKGCGKYWLCTVTRKTCIAVLASRNNTLDIQWGRRSQYPVGFADGFFPGWHAPAIPAGADHALRR